MFGFEIFTCIIICKNKPKMLLWCKWLAISMALFCKNPVPTSGFILVDLPLMLVFTKLSSSLSWISQTNVRTKIRYSGWIWHSHTLDTAHLKPTQLSGHRQSYETPYIRDQTPACAWSRSHCFLRHQSVTPHRLLVLPIYTRKYWVEFHSYFHECTVICWYIWLLTTTVTGKVGDKYTHMWHGEFHPTKCTATQL